MREVDMFLVVSNTGNWDHDMWGVVAAVEDMKGFNDYVLTTYQRKTLAYGL